MLDTSELLAAVDPNHDKQSQKDDIIDRLRMDDSLDIPIQLTDVDVWKNYTNDDLYAMDKKIREFLKKIRYTKEKKGIYKTTASFVFTWIYGRKPTPSDSGACRLINRLLEYYCTGYTGKTTFQGKVVGRVYKFSRYGARGKRAYSLRLRLEEAGENSASIWKANPGAGKDKRLVNGRLDSELGKNANERSGDDL